MRRFLTEIFSNPVVLRDIGWKYARPFMGFIPRIYAQSFILFIFIFMFYAIMFAVLRRSRWNLEDLAFPIFFISIGSGFLMLLLAAASSVRVWRKDRDMGKLVDLIMTGMDLKMLAHGKIIARGFPVLMTTIFFCAHLVVAMVYNCINFFSSVSLSEFNNWYVWMDEEFIGLNLLSIFGILLHMSALLIYIEGLRISLIRKRFVINVIKTFFSLFTYPLLWLFFFLILAYVLIRFDFWFTEIVLGYSILYLLTVPPSVYLLRIIIQYRRLLHTVVYHYNLQLDEGE